MSAQDNHEQNVLEPITTERVDLKYWSQSLGVHRTTLWRWLMRKTNPTFENQDVYMQFLRGINATSELDKHQIAQ